MARAAGWHLWRCQLAAHNLFRRGARQCDPRSSAAGRRLFLSAVVDQLAAGRNPGILDWYTVIGGLVALVALTLHGALWLSIKISGDLEQRARRIVTPLWIALVILTVVSLIATISIRPQNLNNYYQYPFTFVVPVGVLASLAGIWLWNRNAQPVKAFLSSCLYLFFMLAGACWGLYPTLLPATTDPERDITLSHAISGPHTLAVGLIWWGFGMALATCYTIFVYTRFKGKSDLGVSGH